MQMSFNYFFIGINNIQTEWGSNQKDSIEPTGIFNICNLCKEY